MRTLGAHVVLAERLGLVRSSSAEARQWANPALAGDLAVMRQDRTSQAPLEKS